MASELSPTAPEALANEALATDALVKREALRLLAAVVALLAAVLLTAGGLLWREHARGRHPPAPAASVTAAR